jgi:replication factor C subunit 3/5
MIPWVEKYRPTSFDKIVMGADTRRVFQTMLDRRYIPNLLLHGSPGTGKTTTIINLIDAYQTLMGEANKGLMIHLNASDDRGIDVIRAQINGFVTSKTFFGSGTKFVLLDEIDYMTKPAQLALRHMMQECTCAARFCIICNYVSKLDGSLQDSFVKIHFVSMPRADVAAFLKSVAHAEGVPLSDAQAYQIQSLFGSDLRSMLNYLQTNQADIKALDCAVWETLYAAIAHESVEALEERVSELEAAYCTEPLSIIKDFLYYGILHDLVPLHKLEALGYAIHNYKAETKDVIPYVLMTLKQH